MQEERGVIEALSDQGSAGREGRAYVILVFYLFLKKECCFEPPKNKIKYVRVEFSL